MRGKERIKSAFAVLSVIVIHELLHREKRRPWPIELLEEALVLFLIPLGLAWIGHKRRQEASRQ